MLVRKQSNVLLFVTLVVPLVEFTESLPLLDPESERIDTVQQLERSRAILIENLSALPEFIDKKIHQQMKGNHKFGHNHGDPLFNKVSHDSLFQAQFKEKYDRLKARLDHIDSELLVFNTPKPQYRSSSHTPSSIGSTSKSQTVSDYGQDFTSHTGDDIYDFLFPTTPNVRQTSFSPIESNKDSQSSQLLGNLISALSAIDCL